MLDLKAGVSRQFDRGASTYDRHAAVQKLMADRLISRLSSGRREFSSILEVGCGTGYLTSRLAERFASAAITAVDVSPRMVEVASSRLPSSQVEFVTADVEARSWAGESYDLVVSSATLQWLAVPERTLPLLAGALRPGGVMLHSTFGPQTFCELHAILDEVERPSARRIPLLTAERWKSILQGSGLDDVEAAACLEVRGYPDFPAFLAALKGTGASFNPFRPGCWQGYRTLKNVAGRYGERFASPGGIRVTYELIELYAARAG